MLLHYTLAGGAGSVIGYPVELSVEVPEGCSGARLQEAVARQFGTGRLVVAGAPLTALTAGTPPLVNGAVLIDGWAPGEPSDGKRPQPGAPLLLAVLSGPGAGMVLPLHRGSYGIGRSGTDLSLPDAELSREHARLDVSNAGITLVDLGSANGTWVDGRRVLSTAVSTGSLIRCGNSTLSVIFRETSREGPELYPAGEDVSEPLLVAGPGPASQRGLLVLAAGLPLVAGVILAAVTGTWMFLAFSAFSAIPVLLPAVSGRRQRRERREAVAAAVRLDAERRWGCAPPAARLVLATTRAGPGTALGQDSPAAPENAAGAAEPLKRGPVWLRLGLAEQSANIRLEPPERGFRPPPPAALPVTLGASAVTALQGPPEAVGGLVRFFLMQLAGYPRGSGTWVHVHGPLHSIPLAARFLPRVSLSANPAVTAARLGQGPGPGCDRGVLVLLPGTGSADALRSADILRSAAARFGWQLIDCARVAMMAAASGDQSVVLSGSMGRLTSGSHTVDFVPDLVPEQVFDRFCRQLPGEVVPAREPRAVPAFCFLDEVLPLSEARVAQRWAAAVRTPLQPVALAVPVGRGMTGPVGVDLQSDGPHLLVAGTTGSGKSEFLRTLVAGLAASYPPDRVNFLFVDFKGGSGLAPLTGLPHCVGLLTDLDPHEMDRTLISLRAEVRRREMLLAEAEVPDLVSYRARGMDLPALPHLVLVIDEFRMLVEEAPAALAELMRLAVIGRALGIHLVMATQRPQGALTADIRANVTSSVVLRVQSDLESADVMNSRVAAAIPVDCPGRAYLVRGNGTPVQLQTATVSAPLRIAAVDAITVMRAETLLDLPSGLLPSTDGRPCPPAGSVDSVGPFVELTARLWASQGGAPARRPVVTPLPPVLVSPGLQECERDGALSAREVPLGVVDLPEQQLVRQLSWDPDRHGHLAMVGGTRIAGPGGPVETLRLVLERLIQADVESHFYLLDGDGSLAAAAPSPRVGAWVGPQDAGRAARVLTRISEEVNSRLVDAPLPKPPPLILVLHNWGSWLSKFRSGPLAWAEDVVHDILRDGPKAGVVGMLTGERELVTSRFFAALPNRIYFPAGSTEEDRLAWPPMPRLPALPGRVVVSGMSARTETPNGWPAPPGNGWSTRDVLRAAQLFQKPAGTSGGRPLPSPPAGNVQSRPFRVEALPALVTVEEVRSRLETLHRESARRGAVVVEPALRPAPPAPTAPTALCPAQTAPEAPKVPNAPRAQSAPTAPTAPTGTLLVGVGGDELLPAGIVLPPGGVLAVLGGPGSGKSALLRALPLLNPARTWIGSREETGREAYWTGIRAQALAGALDRAAIILADDLDLATRDVNDKLLQLNSLGWTVVFTAGHGPALQQRVPLALSVRRHGKGILIQPQSMMDAELFSIRFEPEPRPPAGRAVVISDCRVMAVQLALAPDRAQPGTDP
ncbi:FtsK/SpoIIIE domain-containing protein [Arthrobacter sp. B3I4]|uniref:FtsK/SpoIIIE domain-containing protein n=1 Tax=Arthrobacter sp. B3I4 TaxID=3042267 RepID=UPI002785E6FE|nr:FtsK/SpoIIIE domain-containing protein [Arthrobacter sp. B3I4]MDQ0755752.1 S-DNA-T family DNA segregation ATPase FtsK/SpoIIIE [Arthrobacter sp. B3I4]